MYKIPEMMVKQLLTVCLCDTECCFPSVIRRTATRTVSLLLSFKGYILLYSKDFGVENVAFQSQALFKNEISRLRNCEQYR